MAANLELIQDFCRHQLKNEKTGHDFAHAKRVTKSAEKILQTEQADESVVLAACYLHDLVDDKVQGKDITPLILENLKKAGFRPQQSDHIFQIISQLSFSYGLDHEVDLSLEGKIVQDADRLDALGAIGIMRAAYYGGSVGEELYTPKKNVRQNLSKKEYRQNHTVIHHFYEKLFVIADTMQTAYGQKEGQRRKKFMEEFLAEFFEEWNAE